MKSLAGWTSRSSCLKGNLVILAVAFIVATVFAAVVKAFDRRHHHADHRPDLWQAELRRAVVHDQLEPLPLWRLHQRGDHVRDHRRRGLLLRGQALPGLRRATREGRHDDQELPRVPDRDPGQGDSLLCLHGAAAGCSWLGKSQAGHNSQNPLLRWKVLRLVTFIDAQLANPFAERRPFCELKSVAMRSEACRSAPPASAPDDHLPGETTSRRRRSAATLITRPRRPRLNCTMPADLAKIVSSLPMPTPSPGLKTVPR